MWPFNKKETVCEDDAVCAWEYNGKLFKNKEARDAARADEELSQKRRRLVNTIMHILNTEHIYSSNSIEEKYINLREAAFIADIIIDKWDRLSPHFNDIEDYTREKVYRSLPRFK